jgi:hypothetical protein
VGWTTEYKPAVRVGGGTSHPEGHTMLLGRTSVSSAGPRAADLTFERDVVRTSRGLPSVYRFSVPTGNQTGDRAVELSKLMVRSPTFPLEVWTGDTWAPLSCGSCVSSIPPGFATATSCAPPGPCVTFPVPIRPAPGNTFFETRVPPEAVRDGSIYIRFPQGGTSFSTDTSFSVRETT